jgi:hypothetical protein
MTDRFGWLGRFVGMALMGCLAVGCGGSPAAGGPGADGAAGPGADGGALVNVGAGPWSFTTTPSIPTPADDLTVFAFSQVGTNASDPQVLALAPDMVMRAWQAWDGVGTKASDYNFAYTTACQAAGIRFIGGSTATAMFQDQWTTDAEFQSVVTRDASGAPVVHNQILPNLYRGSMANPDYRAYLVAIAKLQIDGGVDGLYFDEINADYEGASFDFNEGFDDYHLADFNAFLLARYPGGAGFAAFAGITDDNLLRGDVPSNDLTHNFNYRRYLATKDWTSSPLTSANPLAALWGPASTSRAPATPTNFSDQAEIYRYWPQIVEELRGYALQQHGRQLFISANGLYPFVDFQGVGLFDYNGDDGSSAGPGANYVPTTAAGQLDGTQTLRGPFASLYTRSAALAPGAPVVIFLDWPSGPMSRYLALPASQQQDYWRLYAAEAYASGLYFAFHLMDTIGDPSATTLGLMPLFESLTAYYRAHATLYHHTTPASATATASLASATIATWDQTSPNRRLVHVVNHEYAGAIQPQTGVTVAIPSATPPQSVTLASPDLAADSPLPFTYAAGQIGVTLPTLEAYDVVVVGY